MKILNYKKQKTEVLITLDIDSDVFDITMPTKDFSIWEKLAKTYKDPIGKKEENQFMELVSKTAGDFYAARKKFAVIKTIEKDINNFMKELQIA